MQKIFYKLLRQRRRQLWSPIVGHSFKIRYFKNRWTYPKPNGDGFLYVFGNLSDAKKYKATGECIYACEVEKKALELYSESNSTFRTRRVRLLTRVTTEKEK